MRKGSRYRKSRYLIFRAARKLPIPKDEIKATMIAEGKRKKAVGLTGCFKMKIRTINTTKANAKSTSDPNNEESGINIRGK